MEIFNFSQLEKKILVELLFSLFISVLLATVPVVLTRGISLVLLVPVVLTRVIPLVPVPIVLEVLDELAVVVLDVLVPVVVVNVEVVVVVVIFI